MRVERIGGCTLYLADCMDVLPTLEGVDAIVSDPPYGIAFQKGAGGKGLHSTRNLEPIKSDDAAFDPSHLLRWPCVLFGGNHFYARLPDGGTFHAWDKSCGVGPADSFSDAEFAWTSFRGKSQVIRYLWKGVLQDGEKGLPKYHVMQKPIEVMRWCIDMVPEAQTICDPYMGSGSTGVAAVKAGRKFIGIEVEPRYFDIACERIRKAYAQPDMFVERPPAPKQEAMEL